VLPEAVSALDLQSDYAGRFHWNDFGWIKAVHSPNWGVLPEAVSALGLQFDYAGRFHWND